METTNAVEVVEKKVSNAVASVENMQVNTDEQLAQAVTVLSDLKKLEKFVEQEKEKITVPMRLALDNARALFRPFEEKVAHAIATLKRRATNYQVVKADLAKKEEAKIAKQVETGRIKEETGLKKMEQVQQVETRVKTEKGSATLTYTTKFEIEDESKIPDEYWKLDEVKIGKIVRAGGTIPGVKIIKVPNMAVSA